MKITNFKALSFQKQLVARCSVGNFENNLPVKIFHLDQQEDLQELKRAKCQPSWKDNHYLNTLISYFNNDYQKAKYYVMENQNGDVICTSKIVPRGKKDDLEFIETAPTFSTSNHIRKVKYIGETMLAFLAKDAKEGKKIIEVPLVAPTPKTKNFYFNQCGFEKHGRAGAILTKEKIDMFLKKNEKHTGAKIIIL